MSRGMVEQDGVWYKRVSREKAYRIRCDVPLYMSREKEGFIIPDEFSPEWYRRPQPPPLDPSDRWERPPTYWKEWLYYVRVDTDKEEYNPSDTETR